MLKDVRTGFALRLSADERAALEAAAARARKPPATFARAALMDATRRTKQGRTSQQIEAAPELQEILGHVRRADNNLRQLLLEVQRYQLSRRDWPTGERVETVLEEMSQLRRALTALLRDGAH